jgi:hypothetical protein
MSREYVHVWYDDNDNLLGVDGLRDQVAAVGVYIDNATVTAQILDGQTEAVIPNSSITLQAAGAGGNYRGHYSYTLPLVLGQLYIARLTLDGGGLRGSDDVEFRVQRRH